MNVLQRLDTDAANSTRHKTMVSYAICVMSAAPNGVRVQAGVLRKPLERGLFVILLQAPLLLAAPLTAEHVHDSSEESMLKAHSSLTCWLVL